MHRRNMISGESVPKEKTRKTFVYNKVHDNAFNSKTYTFSLSFLAWSKIAMVYRERTSINEIPFHV